MLHEKCAVRDSDQEVIPLMPCSFETGRRFASPEGLSNNFAMPRIRLFIGTRSSSTYKCRVCPDYVILARGTDGPKHASRVKWLAGKLQAHFQCLPLNHWIPRMQNTLRINTCAPNETSFEYFQLSRSSWGCRR
jgi:hypothetical protein